MEHISEKVGLRFGSRSKHRVTIFMSSGLFIFSGIDGLKVPAPIRVATWTWKVIFGSPQSTYEDLDLDKAALPWKLQWQRFQMPKLIIKYQRILSSYHQSFHCKFYHWYSQEPVSYWCCYGKHTIHFKGPTSEYVVAPLLLVTTRDIPKSEILAFKSLVNFSKSSENSLKYQNISSSQITMNNLFVGQVQHALKFQKKIQRNWNTRSDASNNLHFLVITYFFFS